MDRPPIGRKPAGSGLGSWCRRAGNRKMWLRLGRDWGRGEPVGQQSPPGREVFQPWAARQHAGGRPKLNDRQRGQIPELLTRGPAACGFSGEVWTRARVAQVIEREFACPTTLPRWDGYCGAAAGVGKSRRCVPPNGMRTQSKTGGIGAAPNSKKRPGRRPDHPVG